jgi:putative thioredoxin
MRSIDRVDRCMTTAVRNITEAEFDTVVVEGSKTRPVVVDFWAPWCGPCRTLSPLLERVAEQYAGDVDVVKLNVDDAQSVAARYRVQGIPAVKAFKDGAVAGEFVGMQAEPVIERLFAAVAPSEADRLVERAGAETDGNAAEALLRQALDLQRDHPRAVVELATILATRDEPDKAVQLLERVPADADARRLLAQLHLGGAEAEEDLDALRSAAASGDAAAALRLGRFLAGRSDYAEALPHLLVAVRDPQLRDEARGSVVTVFEVLGPEAELVRQWRPKLAAALF